MRDRVVWTLQAGEEEIADGEAGHLAAGQDAADAVNQSLGAIVYDVVGYKRLL